MKTHNLRHNTPPKNKKQSSKPREKEAFFKIGKLMVSFSLVFDDQNFSQNVWKVLGIAPIIIVIS